MCLAQGHNAVPSLRLEPATLRSQVKHSTTEPLLFHVISLNLDQWIRCYVKSFILEEGHMRNISLKLF